VGADLGGRGVFGVEQRLVGAGGVVVAVVGEGDVDQEPAAAFGGGDGGGGEGGGVGEGGGGVAEGVGGGDAVADQVHEGDVACGGAAQRDSGCGVGEVVAEVVDGGEGELQGVVDVPGDGRRCRAGVEPRRARGAAAVWAAVTVRSAAIHSRPLGESLTSTRAVRAVVAEVGAAAREPG
jgi:hypothetical protein